MHRTLFYRSTRSAFSDTICYSSLSLASASLDVFLLRSHALPLPYLISPAITFLTYLSPLAYLSLLRASANSGTLQEHKSNLPDFDISISALRSYLSSHPRPRGVTTATLLLTPIDHPQSAHDSMSMPGLATRPTFSLVADGAAINHTFPQLTNLLSDPSTGQYAWMLDFTQGGKYRGVVMSQSRMRDIELVVNPLGDIDHMHSVGMMSFGTGSWVDLLVNRSIVSYQASVVLISIYRSIRRATHLQNVTLRYTYVGSTICTICCSLTNLDEAFSYIFPPTFTITPLGP